MSFGISLNWGGGDTAQLFTTDFDQAYKDHEWTLYSKGNTPPKPGAAPGPHPGPGPHPSPTPGCGSKYAMPCGADAKVDCGVRELALKYATSLLPGNEQKVFDALELGTRCNGTRYSLPDRTPTAGSPGHHPTDQAAQLFVDPVKGSDTAGDGSEAKPFMSIRHAVNVTRKSLADSGVTTIVLRAGTHYLTQTLELEARDSGLHFINYHVEERDEDVVISGAQLITDLKWQPSDHPAHHRKSGAPVGVFMAKVS
jgi:hypothetical protein